MESMARVRDLKVMPASFASNYHSTLWTSWISCRPMCCGFRSLGRRFRTFSGFRGFRYLAKVAFEWISWISIFRQWISYILWISWISTFRQTRGRTSVFDRRTFPVPRSTCSGLVTTYVGKPSTIGQPSRLAFYPFGVDKLSNEPLYRMCSGRAN